MPLILEGHRHREQAFRGHSLGGEGGAMPFRGLYLYLTILTWKQQEFNLNI